MMKRLHFLLQGDEDDKEPQLEVEMICSCGYKARTFKHHLNGHRVIVFTCRVCGSLRRVFLNGKEIHYSA